MEEAAFIKPEIRDKIIIPLLTRTGSVLLTISTLGPMFDSWKRQTECRDDQGRPVFLVKTYSLVCDDCIEKGMPEQCMHKQDLLPRWQSSEDEAKVKAIMSNNPDAWRREALGIQGDQDFIPAFTPRGLAFLLQRDGEPAEPSTAMQTNDNLPSTCMVCRLLNQSYQYCFIAVDPAAGSTLSNYAVVSTVFETNGTVVVMGMEDFPLSKTTIVSDLFYRHLDALRGRFPEFSNTMFVVAPECNMGRDSTELAHAVIQYRDKTPQHRGKILILDDDPTNFGLRTGGPNPLLSKDNLRATAAPTINGRKLRFHSNMVCVCDQIRGTTADVVMNRFVDQLQRYGADIERPADPSKPAKLRWHGKRGSTHDDLAMAFQLNLVANELFMRRPTHYGGRNPLDLRFT